MATQNIVVRAKKKKAAALVQSNQLAEAKTLYGEICIKDPKDADAWWNLAQVNAKLGSFEVAVACYRQFINLRPRHGEAHMELGVALQSLGRLDEARQSYRQARQRLPNSAAVHSNLGTVLAKQGRLEKAALSFERALELQPELAPVHYNLGAIYQSQGRFDDAVERYQQALRLEPNWATVHYSLATVLLPLGRTEGAILSLQEALQRKPDYAEAWLYLGVANILQGKFAVAVKALQRAISLNPEDAQAHARLAEAYERRHQLDQASQAVDRALELRPDLPIAGLLAARLARHAGDYHKARVGLDRLISGTPPASTLAEAQVERGFVLDGLGEYAAAFAAFAAGQRLAARLPNAAHLDKDAFFHAIAKNREWFTRERVAGWGDTVMADGLPAPIFLVGFPRSGTTLTEQILGSHPQLVTSDEQPMLPHVLRRLREQCGGEAAYPACLDQLNTDKIRALRAYYWERAKELVGSRVEGRRLVDKHPLNSVHAGLIRRLFPEAKIIFVLRDPRDTCLSCFMQSFKPNQAMINFFDIERTARVYVAVMDLWSHFRSVLGLEYLELRYEDLVFDLESTARRLVEFIGLAWDPALLGFYDQAKEKQITTPSYQAVTSPIYTRSVGRWRNYREPLAPILPVLQPFVELFGYDQLPEKSPAVELQDAT